MAVEVDLQFRENQLRRIKAVLGKVPLNNSSILSEINQKLAGINFEKVYSFSDLPIVFDLIINELSVCQEERDAFGRKFKVAKKKIADLESRGIFVSDDDRISPEFVPSVLDTSSEEIDRLRKQVEELEAEKIESNNLLEKALREAERIHFELEAELERNCQEKEQLVSEVAKYNKQVHEKERELEIIKADLKDAQNQKVGLPGATSTFRQPVITNLLSGESSPEDMRSVEESVRSSPSVSSVASLRAVHEAAFNELKMLGAQRDIDEMQVALRSAERELTLAKSRVSESAAVESQLARVNRDLIEKDTKIVSLERQIQVRDAELVSLRSRATESSQMKDMSDQLRNNLTTIQQLQEGLDEMTSKVVQDERKSKSDLNDAIMRNRKLEAELVDMRISLAQARDMGDRKSVEIAELENDIDTLISKLQKKSDQISDLESQLVKVTSAGGDISDLTDQLRTASLRCRQLESQAEESAETVRRLDLTLKQAQSISDTRISELESTLSRLREESLGNSVAVSKLETELGIERSKTSVLTKEIESTVLLVKEKTNIANRAEEEINKLRREKIGIEADLEATKFDARLLQSSSDMSVLLSNLRLESSDKSAQILELKSANETLRTELTDVRRNLVSSRNELESNQSVIADLRTQLSSVEKARDTFSVELLKKSEMVTKLQASLATVKTENDLMSATGSVSDLEEELAIIRFEKQTLQDDLAQANTEIDRLGRLVRDLEDRNLKECESRDGQLRNILLKITGENSTGGSFEHMLSTLSAHMESLKSQLATRSEEISTLQNQLDSMSSSALSTSVTVKSQLDNLLDEMKNLRDECAVKDKEIGQLRTAMEDLKTRHMNELAIVETQLLSVRGLLTDTEADRLVSQEKRLADLRDSQRSQIESVQANARENLSRVETLNSQLQARLDEVEKRILNQSISADVLKRQHLDEVRSLRSELDSSKTKIAFLESRISDEVAGVEALRKLAGSSISEHAELDNQIEQLKKLMNQMKSEHEQEVFEFMEQLVAATDNMESVIREIYDQKISAIETIRGQEMVVRPVSPRRCRGENESVTIGLSRLQKELIAARDDFSTVVDREVVVRKLELVHAAELEKMSAVLSEREATIASLKQSMDKVQTVLEQVRGDNEKLSRTEVALHADIEQSRKKIAELESSDFGNQDDFAAITLELIETAEFIESVLVEINEVKVAAIKSVREIENYPTSKLVIPQPLVDPIDSSNLTVLREHICALKNEVAKQRDDFINVVDREIVSAKLNTVHEQELVLLRKEHELKLAELSDKVKSRDIVVAELKQTISDHNLIIDAKNKDVIELRDLVSSLQVKSTQLESDKNILAQELTERRLLCVQLNEQIAETESAHEIALSTLSEEMVSMAESMESIMREIYEQKISAIESLRGYQVTADFSAVTTVVSPSRRTRPADIDSLRSRLAEMKTDIMEQRSDFKKIIDNEIIVAKIKNSHEVELEVISSEFANKINSLNDMVRDRDSQIALLRQSMQNSSDDIKLDLAQRDLEIVSLSKTIAELRLSHVRELELANTQAEQLRHQIVEVETSALGRSEQRIGDLHENYKRQILAIQKTSEDEKTKREFEIQRLIEIEADYVVKLELVRADLVERDMIISQLKSSISELENTQMVERILIATNSAAEMNALDNARIELASVHEKEKRELESLLRFEMEELCRMHENDRLEFERERIEADRVANELKQVIVDKSGQIQELEGRMAALKSEHDCELESVKTRLSETIETEAVSKESIISDFENRMSVLREEHYRELGIVRTELEESRSVFELQLKKLEERILESENDTEKILSLHELEIDALISPRETQRQFLQAEINRLETAIQDLESMHASGIAGKDAEIDELKRVIDSIGAEFEVAEKVHETELDEFENQVRSSVELLNQSVDAVNEQHDIVVDSIRETFSLQLAELRAEHSETIDLLESELERRADEIDSLKKVEEELKLHVEQSRKGHEMELFGLNELMNQMKENHSLQIVDLETQIKNMRDLLSETEIASAARFEQRIKDLTDSHNRQIDTLRASSKEELIMRNAELDRLQNELEAKGNLYREMCEKYEVFVQHKLEEFESLMKKIARKDGEISAQSEQLEKLYSEISDMRVKNGEYVALLESNIAELEMKMADSLVLAQQHEDKRVAQLESEFFVKLQAAQQVENERDKLLVELEKKEKWISELESRKAELESRISEIELNNSNKENIAIVLSSSNSQLSQKIEKLSSDLLEARKLARNAMAQYEDQTHDLESLKQELGDTEEELGGLNFKHDEQFRELLRLQEADILAQKTISELQGSCKSSKQLSEKSQAELTSVLVELKSAKNEIGVLKSRVSQLQNQVHDQQLEIELMDAEVSMKASEALKRQVSTEPSPRSATTSGVQLSSSRTFGSENNFSPSTRRPPSRVPTLGLPIPARQRSGSVASSVVSVPDMRDADIEALQGYASARDKKIKSLLKSEEFLRNEIATLSAQLTENEQVVREAEFLKTRVEFLTRELEKAYVPQTVNLESYIESTRKLEEQLMLAKLDIERLTKSSSSVSALNIEIDRLQKSEHKLLNRIEKLKVQVDEVDNLRDKILSLEEQLSSVSIENEPDLSSENKIRELTKALASQEGEMDKLTNRMRLLQGNVDSMEKDKLVIVRQKLDLEIAFRELSVKYEEQIGRFELELKEAKSTADELRRIIAQNEKKRADGDIVVGLHDLVHTLETRIRTPTPPPTEFFDPQSPSVLDPDEITIDTVESLVQQLSLARGELEEIRRIASYMDASSVVVSPKSSTSTVAKDHARIAMISDSVARFIDRVSSIERAVGTLKEEHKRGFVSVDEAVKLQQRVSSLQAALDREVDKRKIIKTTVKELCDKTTNLCNKYSFGNN